MIEDFNGRVAVVTGGASGIGKAIASASKAAGMTVVIADVEQSALSATCEELRVEGVLIDVTEPTSVMSLAAHVRDGFGNCDVLFNNAGVAPTGLLRDLTLHDWNWAIDVNLRSVVHVIHEFLPMMLENKRDTHIVNTASVAGLTPHFISAAYTATKYAVVAISESMRDELSGTTVGVSVLCPGLVRTNLGNDERNRPASLVNPDPGKRKAKWSVRTPVPPVVLDASVVADATLAAIRTGDFWILTDPSLVAWAGLVTKNCGHSHSPEGPRLTDTRTPIRATLMRRSRSDVVVVCVRGYDGATALFDDPGSIGQPTRTATRTRRLHRHCCCPLHR